MRLFHVQNLTQKVVNLLVDVKKAEFNMAKSFGFVPKYHVSHSVNRKHYFLNDSDYIQMLKILQGRVVFSSFIIYEGV
jgi:hypothetical protein